MMRRILLFSLSFTFTLVTAAQINLSLTVQSGNPTTTCTDVLGAPDPMFGVAVNGGAMFYYPDDAGCFNSLPNTQWTEAFACPATLPPTIEVCATAFENDGIILPPFSCQIDESCQESLCQTFALPAPGQSIDYALEVSPGGASNVTVNFTLSLDPYPFPDNDLICNAVDLGQLPYGDTLGNAGLGAFTNACATSLGEPQPAGQGSYFTNEHGVWFRFNSGPSPSGFIGIDIFSDPEGLGAPINLEAVPYLSDNGQCDGSLSLAPLFTWESGTNNNLLRILCPLPDTDYYILVDGDANDLPQGLFGIQVWDAGVPEGGDLRCDLTDLGEVPVGGSVNSGLVSNYCATSAQDPFFSTFVSQHSVWFSFVAPPSGHVLIEGISDRIKDSIGVQLALFRSFSNSCNGFYTHVASQYTFEDLDESMEVSCLYPGRPYYILVDGDGGNSRGILEVTVSDAGDITPVTTLDTVVCAGGSVTVAGNTYTLSGSYADTLNVFAGCDSIINTNLTVLEPLTATIEQTAQAIGLGGLSGEATAAATGGDGNYSYLWCSGETTAAATMLPGGDNCCVTVTDGAGCEAIECFTVDYTTAIIPTFTNDTLLCNGDTDGQVVFSAVNGVPPYQFSWQSADGNLSGNGTLAAAGDEAVLDNLPAGAYTIAINDEFFDTTFLATVTEPAALVLNLDAIIDASCFGFADGAVLTSTEGGTPPYQFTWSGTDAADGAATGLGAGNYQLTVTDANGCTVDLDALVNEPGPFIATPAVDQEVSCFGGSDGIASVSTNGQPTAWNWSNGGDEPTINNLPTGDYAVTVTNQDGCRDTVSINVPEPSQPLGLTIEEVNPISCFGAADGSLRGLPTGPFVSLTYEWSDGQTTARADNLDAGSISLLITNEKGCEAEDSYLLTQPDELTANLTKEDLNCLDGPNAGAIVLDSVMGGRPGYTYGLEGQTFGPSNILEGLSAGAYTAVVRDASGCELSLPVSILPPPEITVDLGNQEEVIHLGDSIRLQAMTNADIPLFAWSHADSLTTAAVIVKPKETTLYQVEVTDSVSFCQASTSIRIVVDRNPRIFVPNAFSPNGDGSNEWFFAQAGPEVLLIKTFRIFSREGQLVFEATDIAPNEPTAGWNGRFRGQQLTPQVFVYYLEIALIDGRTEIIKGDVVLVR